MVRLTKIASVAGLLLASSAIPVFAQDLALPGLGGIDLDPFHIFTPAPPAAGATPIAAAHHRHRHHVVKH